jgi:carbamoyl-phosphate synthase large subunit
LGETFSDAISKALKSANFRIPPFNGSVLVTVGDDELKRKIIPLTRELIQMGYKIYATEHTAEALRDADIQDITVLYKIKEPWKEPNILDYLLKGKIDLIINLPMSTIINAPKMYQDTLEDEYTIRRLAVEFNVPVVTTIELALALIQVLKKDASSEIVIQSLNKYLENLSWSYW